MKKKKVLFVATVKSHIEWFHIPYLKLFHEKGYEVHVVTNEESDIPYCDKSISIPIARSPYKISNLKAILNLKKIVEHEKYDVIHCHTPMGSVVARLAAIKARKSGTRVIYTAHGFHFYKGAPLLNWLLFYPIEKWLSKYTDTLITINKEDYDYASDKFSLRCSDIQYVPGVGVNTNKFDFQLSTKEFNELRKEFSIKPSDFVMIFPARLDKNKNQILLINAMEKLLQKHNNIHLLLPGGDELNGYYQNITDSKGLSNNIHFLGHRNDIEKLLKISNLGVSSSLREGLGLNVIEAILCNLPVVVYKNRGHKDIVTSDNGFLFENEEEFINKVEYYYDKFSKNEDISVIHTVDKFLLDSCMPQMKNIYFNENLDKKLLFVHSSEKVKIDDNGNYYTDGCYNDAVWQRYFKLSSNLQVIFRRDKTVYSAEEFKNKFHKLNENIDLITIENRNESIRKFLSLKILLKNNRIIKKAVFNSDMVIARVPCDESFLAIKYAKKYGKKCLCEVVGCPRDTLWNYNIKGKVLAWPTFFKMKKAVKVSDFAIYVTNTFLQKRYPTKGIQLGCSDVALTELDEKVLSNRLDKIKSFDSKKKIVVCTIGTVGVLYKGQQDVIEAISRFRDYDIEYWIIGTGDETYLRKTAKKFNVSSVKFLGFLNHDEIFKKLDKVDIYIQPSYTEGLCRALIEALSRACPCIASNAGGNVELLDDEFVYKKGDVKELTQKIGSLIDDKSMKRQAIINFNTSKEYKKELLDEKRRKFYDLFAEEVGK